MKNERCRMLENRIKLNSVIFYVNNMDIDSDMYTMEAWNWKLNKHKCTRVTLTPPQSSSPVQLYSYARAYTVHELVFVAFDFGRTTKVLLFIRL